jgi:hypothetical protein
LIKTVSDSLENELGDKVEANSKLFMTITNLNDPYLNADGDSDLKKRSGRSKYQKDDGLGLMLLGLMGDQILNQHYARNQSRNLAQVRGNGSRYSKEDQAQNTCIFSTNCLETMLSLKKKYTQLYSVSISGYPYCRGQSYYAVSIYTC